MMLASTATLPGTIPSVSGVTTPTIHPPQAAIMAASVADAANHNQKDTTFTKIFVGGLPYHTSDKSLREHFEVYGDIDEAVVITDRQTGKSRGYGFVTMTDRSGADRAIKDANPVIDGRKANVNLAYLGAKPRGNQTTSRRAWRCVMGSSIVNSLTPDESPRKSLTPDLRGIFGVSSEPSAKAFGSMAPSAMRLYSHLSGAGNPYSNMKGEYAAYLKECSYIQPPASYVYQIPYTSQSHLPFISAQTAHLNPAAATVGYTPSDYPAGAAGYTAAAYPGAQSALEQAYGITFSQASIQNYNYAMSHAAAASAANSFSLGAYHSPAAAAAAAAAAPQQSALQEARMQ